MSPYSRKAVGAPSLTRIVIVSFFLFPSPSMFLSFFLSSFPFFLSVYDNLSLLMNWNYSLICGLLFILLLFCPFLWYSNWSSSFYWYLTVRISFPSFFLCLLSY
jgi:hypothetical protein